MSSKPNDRGSRGIHRRALMGAAVGAAVAGKLSPSAAQAPKPADGGAPIYRSDSGDITIAVAGDTMLTRGLKPFVEDDYLALVQLLRGADIALCNLETSVRMGDEGFSGVGGGGGTPMDTPPRLLEDLKWMGMGAVSYANNHVADYGQTGMQAAFKHLRNADLPFAGAGESLREAQKPAYIDTRAGRVGFIAAASTGAQNRGVDPSGDSPARPGLNPLGYATEYQVDEQSIAALRRLDKELGFAQKRVRDRTQFYPPASVADPKEGTARLGGLEFHQGAGFAVSTRVNRADAEGNLKSIRDAARQSDWQVFSLHNHEFGPGGLLTARNDEEMEDPADFWIDFAHSAVDAGADVVFGHGPHVTLGIEIYKGRPIFYSLGNFIFENDTIQTVPPGYSRGFGLPGDATPGDFMDARSGNGVRSFEIGPEFWQSFVPVCEFRKSKLYQVILHPIDLGFGKGRADRGRPVLARGEIARRILERVAARSKRFGTEITIRDGLGVVRVA